MEIQQTKRKINQSETEKQETGVLQKKRIIEKETMIKRRVGERERENMLLTLKK